MSEAPDLSPQLAASASTDLGVLLKAKEDAKRRVMDDPSPANLAALKSATQMLEAAQSQGSNLKDYSAVLAYIEEAGRKLKKTKLYDDIGKGRLKKQPDGSFRRRDVERYAASLPSLGTSDNVAKAAADRLRRKEEAEIRRIVAAANRDEHRHAVECGKYIARDLVFQELAGRAIVLDAGLRSKFESRALDYVHLAEGSPKKASNLVQALCEDLDAVLNEFAQVETFELLIAPADAAPAAVESEDEA